MNSRLVGYAKIALKAARRSEGKHRHGCVVIGSGGRVLASESNNYANHIHAEVRALNRVDEEHRSSCIVVVVRARKSQQMGLSKPCSSCQEFLEGSGVKAVYYSDDDGGIVMMEEATTTSLPQPLGRFSSESHQRVALRLNRQELHA